MPKLIFSLLLLVVLSGCDLIFKSKDPKLEDPSNSKGLFFITNQITGDTTLVVAINDFPKAMEWGDAKQACENLGNGWRLPDKDELLAMYEQLYSQGKGNFRNDRYWSSTMHVLYQHSWWAALYLDFDDGQVGDNSCVYHEETENLQVRAVRDF